VFGNFAPPVEDYIRILPEIVLAVFGCIVMFLEGVWPEERPKPIMAWTTIAGLVVALWGCVMAYYTPGAAFSNMIVVDGFATYFRVLVLVVGLLTILASMPYLRQERANSGEYYGLILFSICGQCAMAASNDLIMVFIGLEISSIASYILAGYLRDDKRNNESALKYFLLGSFATAFFLYGIAWIWGITGTTTLTDIRLALMNRDMNVNLTLAGTAAALMFVGMAFKISAAPFQVWAPDVYQGAPAPVSAFMSAGPKAAAFAILLRIFITAFGTMSDRWEPYLWFSALLTMIIGNFAALTQTNIKRLLAYSSIASAGYVLVAVTAHSETGTAAAMFYLVAYALMNVGAFAVVGYFARQGERFVNVEDLAGLGFKRPLVAAMMTIFLLSMIGVPLTGGFFGKFYIFKAALDSNLIWLTVLGLLNSAVAAYYYLRIIVVMYMYDTSEATGEIGPVSPSLSLAMLASAAGTIVLGVFPSLVLNFAGRHSTLAR
jgi:NADH-quinone oxidoreductase subunit N